MKSPFLFTLLAATLAASECEDSFSKQGNPLTGTKYNAAVTVKDLSVADAIAQLHGIAIGKKLDILSEDPAGSMLLEDRASFRHKAIPYVVSVSANGAAATIQLLVKLNKGAIAKSEDARTEMCGILNQVKGGDEGHQAALNGASAVSKEGPRRVDAYKLSLELAREMKDSPESIPLRYKGRAFTITGRADYVIKDGDVYRVAFEIPEPGSFISLGPADPTFKVNINCLMAPNQSAWAVALRKGEKLALTGIFLNSDQFRKSIWLENCKPE